jgi:hypothetical protein
MQQQHVMLHYDWFVAIAEAHGVEASGGVNTSWP